MKEGSPNQHPGQGTACRRFFFGNAYLELLWVGDAEEAKAEPARGTGLWERWSRRRSGASPFGVVLRPGAGGADQGPPFPAWSYRPQYLPPGFAIEIAAGTTLDEPELFYISFARRPDEIGREPTAHGIPVAEITRVSIGIPGPGARSTAARSMEAAGVVSFSPSHEHVMTLSFDEEARGRVADLQPELPLVLRW